MTAAASCAMYSCYTTVHIAHLDQPLQLMLHAFGILVDQIDLEDVGGRVVTIEPHSFLGIDLCAFQYGIDTCVLAIGAQEVVHPVTIPTLDNVHTDSEPLAYVDVHHFGLGHISCASHF